MSSLMPALRYDKQRRMLVPETAAQSLHAPASAKSAMHTLRLAMLEGRVRRHPMFKPPVLANGINPKEYLELTGIDAQVNPGFSSACATALGSAFEAKMSLPTATDSTCTSRWPARSARASSSHVWSLNAGQLVARKASMIAGRLRSTCSR